MEYHKFEQVFCDIMPILEKAAPLISGLTGSPITGMIVGLLASIVGGDACDHADIAEKLKADPDLYAKLAKLDCTHAQWLKNLLIQKK